MNAHMSLADLLGQVFEGQCRQTVAAGNRSRSMCFVEYASTSSKHAIVLDDSILKYKIRSSLLDRPPRIKHLFPSSYLYRVLEPPW